jgi:hypothetical protein
MLAAVVIAEIALRSSGHKPWKEVDEASWIFPRMHEPDPDLGWRSKEGRYVFGTTPIHMTFWWDHTRATQEHAKFKEGVLKISGMDACVAISAPSSMEILPKNSEGR